MDLQQAPAEDPVVAIALVAFCLAVGTINARTHRVLNVITAPAAIAAPALIALTGGPLTEALIGGAVAFAATFLVAFAFPAKLGMGTVKEAGVLGLFLGLHAAVMLAAATLNLLAQSAASRGNPVFAASPALELAALAAALGAAYGATPVWAAAGVVLSLAALPLVTRAPEPRRWTA